MGIDFLFEHVCVVLQLSAVTVAACQTQEEK